MGNENPTRLQTDAIQARTGSWLVAAGAGSGKTKVVTQRFVDILRGGEADIDQILTITFTNKAAGQMLTKVRALLKKEGMLEERRRIERAKISTIHGFCASIVKANALALGLDPGFRVTDDVQASIIKQEVFLETVARLVSTRGRKAIDLISAYEPNRSSTLFDTIIKAHGSLRSRGLNVTFDLPAADLEPPREALRIAVADAIREMGDKKTVTRESLDMLNEAIVEADGAKARRLLKDCKLTASGNAKEAINLVKTARDDLLRAYQSVDALPDLEIIRDLLVAFSDDYAIAKRGRSLLDFEDLELYTAYLLENTEAIRKGLAERFRFIMVDEFQDTNALQCRIIDRIARDNILLVGDANQSIYRFRNADVSMFQKRKSSIAPGNLLSLPDNFRSQAEILAFIDHVFTQPGMLPSETYISLQPGAEQFPDEEPFRVEVILVDGDSHDTEKANNDVSRPAEGTLIAARLKELKRAGLFDFGDMAILLRAATDVEYYREALERAGIPNYVSIGRDYYKKLEFGDALCLLNLLINPLDDVSLISVLRSPMLAVSDDTLYWLRQSAGFDRSDLGRPLWPALAGGEVREKILPEEWDKLARFLTDYESMRQRSRRDSLDAIMREVTNYNDYAAIVATGYNGRQAYANLMKLVDKAAEFEAAEGRDLAAFAAYLAQQQAEEFAENEAPTAEEEGGGAVRLMTIHSAKGLEFPVVVWADMGYRPNNNRPVLLVGDGQVGLVHKVLGEKEAELFDYRELQERERKLELDEDKRIGYVAMTRAKRHLILSGTSNFDKPPGGPESMISVEWLRAALSLVSGNHDFDRLRTATADDGIPAPVTVKTGNGVAVGLTLCSDPETVLQADSWEKAGSGPGDLNGIEPVSGNVGIFPDPALFVPTEVNASSLDTYISAPCRFYLENILRMGSAFAGRAGKQAADTSEAAPPVSGNLERKDMGTLVHAVLEREMRTLGDVDEATLDRIAGMELGADVVLDEEDYRLAFELIGNFREAPIAAELLPLAGTPELLFESDFSIMIGQTIVRGKIDAIYPRDGHIVVVDYKTGIVGDEDTATDIATHYEAQMMCYALAAREMGASRVEVVLVLLDRPGMEYREVIEASGLDDIESRLQELIKSMETASFRAFAQPNPRYCAFCAGSQGKMPVCPTISAGISG